MPRGGAQEPPGAEFDQPLRHLDGRAVPGHLVQWREPLRAAGPRAVDAAGVRQREQRGSGTDDLRSFTETAADLVPLPGFVGNPQVPGVIRELDAGAGDRVDLRPALQIPVPAGHPQYVPAQFDAVPTLLTGYRK